MRFCVAVFVLLISASISQAQMDVFLNFDADWINNLNDLTASAGVDSFDSTETGQIESIIESEFSRVFSEFDLTFFSPGDPPPPAAFTTVDYGAITSSGGLLGSAPGDFFNVGVTQTANVFTANFDFFIDEFSGSNNRSQQINQVATALAGTGAHELGHSVGLFHVHAYGTQGITPANYSNTLGLQNGNIMATGPTGLSESERETQRVLSQFSKLAMEAAGGLDASLHGFTGTSLAPNVVLQETDFLTVDAGKSFITASQLQLEAMPISGLDAVHVHSDITGTTDSDFYQIDLTAPGFLSAQIVSRRFPTLPDFDGVISVFDADENLLISFDATRFSGDEFGTGTLRTDDPFIANLELDSAGTYYIQVSSTANDSSGNYSLLIGVDSISVPEPASGGVLLTAVAMLMTRRRKRA